jgi:cation:H+ antiporter
MTFAINSLLYLLAFFLIWIGSGLIVSSIDRFSKRLKLSRFIMSFVILGLLTSTPEFAVGLQAIADHDPEIFVGNLLGGIPVLFLLVIPLLAILGNGINLKHELGKKTLLFALAVILAPSILVLDKRVSNPEGIVLIVLYLILVFVVQKRHGLFDKDNSLALDIKAYSYKDVLKILLGIGIVFVSSNIIVDKTMYFANVFNISAFYIGLIAISIGTNLPELSLAVRSVISGKKDVAMGDYLGSAAVNTLLFGVFTLLHAGEVITMNGFLITFLFIAAALVLFYIFVQSKNIISRKEGLVLFGVYILFVVIELTR